VLKNKEICKNKFLQACELFDKAREEWITTLKKNEYHIKDNKDFTKFLLEKIGNNQNVSLQNEDKRYYGKIAKIGVDRNGLLFGYINTDSDRIFAHSKNSRNFDFTDKENVTVSYKKITDPVKRNIVAAELELVKE
jgi:hypothetical protein